MRGATLANRVNASAALAIGIVAVVCVLMGAALAGGAMLGGHPIVRGAIVGIPLVVIGVVVIAELGPKALPIWIAVSPLAYPFVRYPLHGGGYVTFDRVWIIALFPILLRLPRPPVEDPGGRLLRNGMVLFAAVYGARLLLLPPSPSLADVRLWIDAIVLPIVVYAVTRRIAFHEGHDRLIGSLVIAGVIMSVVSLAELAFGFSLAKLSGGTPAFDSNIGIVRVSGPYASNAASSGAALICLAAAVYWTRLRSGDAKLAGVLAVVIIAGGALASLHRAAGIAVVAILILGTLPGARSRSARYLTISMIGVAAALAFYAVSGSVTNTAFFQDRISSGTNVVGRFAAWEQSVAIFKESPLTGVGPGQAPIVQQHQGLFVVDGQAAPLTLHNSFLTILAENGIVGEAAFLILFGAVVKLVLALRAKREWKNRLLYGAIVAASVGYLVMSLTLTMLLEAPASLVFAVLLGIGAGQLDRDRVASLSRVLAAPQTSPQPMPVALGSQVGANG